ncbi:sex-regulated protein janus-B-like [Drosophila innubila]|uniref:sex-regulated protein janus-B-like n=1 Tax=Drosophila innubila TaxID=198719 RepID=UPI00148D9C39|nr:sex-regulated protein janus-B-like [Drosophila innubila]
MKFATASLPFRVFSNQFLRNFASQKTGKALLTTPKVSIGEGSLNYLLVSIYIHGETLFARTIVRAHKDSHMALYDQVRSDMEEVGLCMKPLGGGMLNVDGKARKIKIHSMCKTFGEADHYRTKEILKSSKKYENYKISVGK